MAHLETMVSQIEYGDVGAGYQVARSSRWACLPGLYHEVTRASYVDRSYRDLAQGIAVVS